MTDKLKFCSEKISCLQRVKRLPSLMQQSQFTCYPPIDLDKRLEHKLVWLCETGDWLVTICEQRISNAGSLWARVRQTVVFFKYLSHDMHPCHIACNRTLIFSETNVVEVPRICKICKIHSLQKRASFSTYLPF